MCYLVSSQENKSIKKKKNMILTKHALSPHTHKILEHITHEQELEKFKA